MSSRYGIDWDEKEINECDGLVMLCTRKLPLSVVGPCGCRFETNWYTTLTASEPSACVVMRNDKPERGCSLNHRDEGAAILADLMRHIEERRNAEASD